MVRRRPPRARPSALEQALYAWIYNYEERGIVTTDAQLIVRHWNPWMAARSGLRSDEAVGQPLFSLFPGLAERLGESYKSALAGQVFVLSQRIHGHVFPMPSEGGRWPRMPQSASIAPLRLDGKVAGTITLVQDVSDRLAREEDLRRLNQELENTVAERTHALGVSTRELDVMLYTLAHDLRSPLRTIRSYTQLVLRAPALGEENRGQLDRVDKAAQRLGQLIDELLEAARLTQRPLHPELCDLSALAESLLADMSVCEPDRRVEVSVTPGLRVVGDSEMLGRMLENLLGNASKFTRRTAAARIEFGLAQEDKAVFCVRDNGAGFDMSHAGQLFGMFTRLHSKEDFSGSGIGLAIVQRVIERHGGRVWAEGQVGRGADFYFTLPGARVR